MKNLNSYISSLFLFCLLFNLNTDQLRAQCAANYSEVCGNSVGPFTFTEFDVDGSECLANEGETAGYIVLNISSSGLLSLNVNGNADEGFIDVAIFNIPEGVAPCVAAASTENQITCNFADFPSGCASFNDPSCPSNLINSELNLSAGDRIIIIAENYSNLAENFTVTLSEEAGSAGSGEPTVDIEDGVFLDNQAPTIVPQGEGNSGGGTYIASCGTCIDAETGMFNPAGLSGEYTITYRQYAPGELCFAEDVATIRVDPATTLTCRQPIVTCNDPGLCGRELTLLPPFINQESSQISITRDGPDSFFPIGTTVLTWSAVDQNDNVLSTCTQNVTVIDEEAPEVSSCSTATAFDYNEDCMAQVTIDVQGSDNCGVASVVGNGTFNFPIGVQLVHPVTITDVNGLTTVHNVIVNVHDEHAPEAVNCPDDLTVMQGSALPNIVPMFTDNCEVYEMSSDIPDEFPLGTTTVTYTAFDYYGNRGECIFDVTITEQNIFMGATAARIEACVEAEETQADIRWNTPNISTVCEYCPTTEYEDYLYVGEFYGHQYFLYQGTQELTNEEANLFAQNLNGHLVSINNLQENNYLAQNIPFGAAAVQTGLTVSFDEEEELVYTWENDDAFDYSNLAIAADIALEGEQIVTLNADGTWTLSHADSPTIFLVERPCVDLRQTGPYIEIENENQEVETVLLKSGDLFPVGVHTVTYEAENLCGDIFVRTFEVVVDEPRANYCETGGGDAGLYIESITIGNLTNTTAEEEMQIGYHDYSAAPIDLNTVISLNEEEEMPESVPVTLTPGGISSSVPVYWNVWADLNLDGDFFDANELILQTTTEESATANLPLELFGEEATGVRVSVSRYDYPEVCADYFSGETEDYSLVLPTRETEVDFRNDENNDDDQATISDANTHLHPNPVSDYMFLHTPILNHESTLRIVDLDGKIILQNKIATGTSQHRIDVAKLGAGVYFAEVINEDNLVRKKFLVVK